MLNKNLSKQQVIAQYPTQVYCFYVLSKSQRFPPALADNLEVSVNYTNSVPDQKRTKLMCHIQLSANYRLHYRYGVTIFRRYYVLNIQYYLVTIWENFFAPSLRKIHENSNQLCMQYKYICHSLGTILLRAMYLVLFDHIQKYLGATPNCCQELPLQDLEDRMGCWGSQLEWLQARQTSYLPYYHISPILLTNHWVHWGKMLLSVHSYFIDLMRD